MDGGGGGGGGGRGGGGGEGELNPLPPPSNPPNSGGQFLLQLLQKPQTATPPPPPPLSNNNNNSNFSDPAVAALGPTLVPFPTWSSNGQDPHHPPWSTTPSPNPPPQNFLLPGFPSNPPWPSHPILPHEIYQLGLLGGAGNPPLQLQHQHQHQQQQQQKQKQQESMLMFGSLACDLRTQEGLLNRSSAKPQTQGEFAAQVDRDFARLNGGSNDSVIMGSKFMQNWESDLPHRMNLERTHLGNQRMSHQQGRGEDVNGEGWGRNQHNVEFQRTPLPEARRVPPGFAQKANGVGHSRGMSEPDHNMGKNVCSQRESDQQVYQRRQSAEHHRIQSDLSMRLGLVGQNDRRGEPLGDRMYPVPAMGIEESLMKLQRESVEGGSAGLARQERKSIDNKGGQSHRRGVERERDDLAEQLMGSMVLRDGFDGTNGMRQQINNSHDKEFKRLWTPPQRMRNYRREVECRNDIDRWNSSFLAVYESLVPPEEEKAKQKQLLASLEKLVNKEWPSAQLYLYGSCANSFGVSKSDIDVCLRIEDADISKSEILLKLADILQSDKLENVQALTRARVPIVKLMDPVTGISCDICINNVLAVVNTKLLRDYAQIDGRLRQLAFIVKHWAKSRGVNETYRGTLSSYAYVLMCIHFLQQRKPAILPCLQGMETTYAVTVDEIDCAFFDRVDNLCEFGARNKETIAQLVWGFFDYWAHRHDYANSVISIRTGSIISKRAKDWTRRIGNDRHLICIEDPFQVSHDLGRVVDKFSIKVLREEFERAANIMQYDPDPHVTLFEPYVPKDSMNESK